MSSSHGLWSREPFLRLGGGVLVAIGSVALRWLFRTATPGLPVDSSAAQLAAAGLGFVGLSLGAALILIGAHLFDQVELSDRWRRRTGALRQSTHLSPREAGCTDASGLRLTAASFAQPSREIPRAS